MFVASNFVLDRLRLGLGPVVHVDKLTCAGNQQNLASVADDADHLFVRADFGDGETMSRLQKEHTVAAILNIEAGTDIGPWIQSPGDLLRTSVQGAFALLNAAHNYFALLTGGGKTALRFINISADEVCGSPSPQVPPFTEASPYRPTRPYPVSRTADHSCRFFFSTGGLSVVTTSYRPCRFREQLIPRMIRSAMRGQALPDHDVGRNFRHGLYVGDHCTAIREVSKNGRIGETYNVGGCAERTSMGVVEALCDILAELGGGGGPGRCRKLIAFVAGRRRHDRRYVVEARKIRDESGWRPSETLETGLRRAVKRCLDNVAWTDCVGSGGYREWLGVNHDLRASYS